MKLSSRWIYKIRSRMSAFSSRYSSCLQFACLFPQVDTYARNHNRFDVTWEDEVKIISFSCLLRWALTTSLYDCRKTASLEELIETKRLHHHDVVCRRMAKIAFVDCWFDGPWRSIKWRRLAVGVVSLHYLSQSNETKRCRAARRVAVAVLRVVVLIFGLDRPSIAINGLFWWQRGIHFDKMMFGIWGDEKSACRPRGYWAQASLQNWRPNAQKNIFG